MLRAKSPSIVDTALSVLETALVWCRAADASDVGLARTGLFELLMQVPNPLPTNSLTHAPNLTTALTSGPAVPD